MGSRGRRAKRPKVLLTRAIHPFAVRQLEGWFDVHVHSGRVPMPRTRLIREVGDAGGLICFPYDRIDAEVIDAAPHLRAISTYSVGFDHIDVGAAVRRGIGVGYTPDVLTDATAELTVALVLDVLRRISEGDRIIRAGRWRRIYGAYEYAGTGAAGKTIGILGMGRIGRAVARKAAALGMDVAYHSRTRLPPPEEARMGAGFVRTAAALASKSDVLSLHVPHTADTDKMIDMAVLRRMKKTAFLINTSRGRIVDEAHLVTALRRGVIAGAGLDVFASEPIGKTHALCRLDNVVLAPHIGSSTAQAREAMAHITVKNILRAMSGRAPVCPVPAGAVTVS